MNLNHKDHQTVPVVTQCDQQMAAHAHRLVSVSDSSNAPEIFNKTLK